MSVANCGCELEIFGDDECCLFLEAIKHIEALLDEALIVTEAGEKARAFLAEAKESPEPTE